MTTQIAEEYEELNADPEIVEIFLEEAQELLEQLYTDLRTWIESPEDPAFLTKIIRCLHTLKGTARTTGILSIGNLSYSYENLIADVDAEQLQYNPQILNLFQQGLDFITKQLEQVRSGGPIAKGKELLAQIENLDTLLKQENLVTKPNSYLRSNSSLFTTSQTEIPLENINIAVRLSGRCSEVTITQRYINKETVNVEAEYSFPLEHNAALCAFTAKVGDRLIRGVVEERKQAHARYAAAKAAGDGAYLLDQLRPDIFTLAVGNIKPQQTVEIAITYVTLLNFEDQAVRLMIPTTVAPQTSTTIDTHSNSSPRNSIPYDLTLNVEIIGNPPQEISSPSHQINIITTDLATNVTLANSSVALDRDFVLLITPENVYQPEARVACESDGTKFVMVTFQPDFVAIPSSGNEVLFLVDCSFSMQGNNIALAIQTLQYCVNALNNLDTLNIICFGSGYSALWPYAFLYQPVNTYIRQIQADMGDTDLVSALQYLLLLPIDPARPRQIVLFTDGQVDQVEAVIELCTQYTATRVFIFSIGIGSNEYLVRGLAKAANGAVEFIYPGERIEPKVMRMFRRINTPAIEDTTLDMHSNVDIDWGGLRVEQAPAKLPPIFSGDSLTVFGRVKSGITNSVSLRAGKYRWEIPLDLSNYESGSPIPTLWARALIHDLETELKLKWYSYLNFRLLKLSIDYGLLSSITSYVAIEERSDADKTTTEAKLRRIPITVIKGSSGARAIDVDTEESITLSDMEDNYLSSPLRVGFAYSSSAFMRANSNDMECLDKPNFLRSSAPAPDADEFFAIDWDYLGDMKLAKLFDDDDLRVSELLKTQQYDGSFLLSTELCHWLGNRIDKVKMAALLKGEALVATFVTIMLLQIEAADQFAQWGTAVTKAQKWLAFNVWQLDIDTLLAQVYAV